MVTICGLKNRPSTQTRKLASMEKMENGKNADGANGFLLSGTHFFASLALRDV